MLTLRQKLATLRDEAREFFAHAEDRGRPEDIRRELACAMAEVSLLIQGSPLLGPTALSSHQRNTRRMASALNLKRYECWDQHITWDEDTPVARKQAGESEDDISVSEAQAVFLEAFDSTIALLDLIEGAAPAQPASSGRAEPRKRGRPQTIPNERKAAALNCKDGGGTNRDAAQIMYDTKYPSSQQVKNVSTLLRLYRARVPKVHPPSPSQKTNKIRG